MCACCVPIGPIARGGKLCTPIGVLLLFIGAFDALISVVCWPICGAIDVFDEFIGIFEFICKFGGIGCLIGGKNGGRPAIPYGPTGGTRYRALAIGLGANGGMAPRYIGEPNGGGGPPGGNVG